MVGCAVSPDPSAERSAESHDPAGADLARSLAHAYREASRPRRARPAKGRKPAETRSGPGPDYRDPQPLDQLMSKVVAEHGWATDVAVHGLFARWDVIVGAEVAEHCRPERFVDGRLAIRADSTAWATQVRLLAPTVLQRLHDELGSDLVQRIDVLAPQGPSWRHGRFSVSDGRGPRDTYG